MGVTPGKTPNRQGLYAKAARYAVNAIEILVYLMENSKNDTVRVSAAKALLDKALPDLRAMELDNAADKELKIIIVDTSGGYKPPEDGIERSQVGESIERSFKSMALAR